MTTTNDLYQAAIANMEQTGEHYGVAKVTLANGDMVICSIEAVAGRSVVRKHIRMTFGLKLAAAEYAKPICKAKVIALLKQG